MRHNQGAAVAAATVADEARSALLADLLGRVAGCFPRRETRQSCGQMLHGLLMELDDRNCWTIAEAAGHRGPHRLQHLLSRAVWDDQQVLDIASAWAVSHLDDGDAVLIVDETADEKSSADCAGAARQYSGTVGGVALCQVAVTLTFATSRGHALIGRALYLPEGCAADEEHRELAGVPEEVLFATKPQLDGPVPPRRVVEVLEAVHLMFALDLFVVVVAFDAGSLIRWMEYHYRELFGPDAKPGAAIPAEAAASPVPAGPVDYLDKIFQIPYVLTPSPPAAVASYLHPLLPAPRLSRLPRPGLLMPTAPAGSRQRQHGLAAVPRPGRRGGAARPSSGPDRLITSAGPAAAPGPGPTWGPRANQDHRLSCRQQGGRRGSSRHTRFAAAGAAGEPARSRVPGPAGTAAADPASS